MTLDQIGKRFNVGAERVRQIEARAFRKLKMHFGVSHTSTGIGRPLPGLGEAKRPVQQGKLTDYPIPKKLNKGVDKIYARVLQRQVDRENGEHVPNVDEQVAVVVAAHPKLLSYGIFKRVGRSGKCHIKLLGGKLKDWAAGDMIAVEPSEVYATWDPSLSDKTAVHRAYNDAGQSTVREATGLKKHVKIVKGPAAGKTGYVGEVHHGLFKGAPKQFVIDLDGGGNIKCSKDELRLIKDDVS